MNGVRTVGRVGRVVILIVEPMTAPTCLPRSSGAWWTSAMAWAADEVCETGGTFGGLSWDGGRGATRGCDADEDQVIAVASATHGYVIYPHVGDDPVLRAKYD